MHLEPNKIYLGDNGRAMCSNIHCAGTTARITGRDLSGQRVIAVRPDEIAYLKKELGKCQCECGAVSK